MSILPPQESIDAGRQIQALIAELAAKDKEIERLKALLQKSIVENALSRLEGPNAAIIAAKTWENFKTEHNL